MSRRRAQQRSNHNDFCVERGLDPYVFGNDKLQGVNPYWKGTALAAEWDLKHPKRKVVQDEVPPLEATATEASQGLRQGLRQAKRHKPDIEIVDLTQEAEEPIVLD